MKKEEMVCQDCLQISVEAADYCALTGKHIEPNDHCSEGSWKEDTEYGEVIWRWGEWIEED